MALESKFVGNEQLRNCLIRDDAHVGMQFNPKGQHVLLIKEALNAWARREQKIDPIPETDVYDQTTADAVTTYKELHTPKILNFKGEIDNIVGKKTVDALDKELPRLGATPIEPPAAPREIADIIVRYIGTRPEVGNVRINNPQEILDDEAIETYLRNHRKDRTLFRIGFRTVSIEADAAFIISEHVRRVKELSEDFDIGKIFIFGSSSGGRNALSLAARLNEKLPQFPISYIGVADPAFFPSDTSDRPSKNEDPPNVVPNFAQFSGLKAEKKENFFQTNGNHTRRENRFPFKIVFTSGLKDEIHGFLTGFDPKKFDNIFGNDDGDRHGRLIGIANRDIKKTIADTLNGIPAPKPTP
jgi:hypothetical protein